MDQGTSLAERDTFNLDTIEMLWNEFEKRRARAAEDKKWLDEFKATLKKVSGDAENYNLRGQRVARLIPGQLNLSLLNKERPDLVERYTRIIAKEQFDTEKFSSEEPDTFEQYRAKRLVLVSEAGVEFVGS